MWRRPAEPTPSKRRVCIQRHKSHLRLHEGFSVVAIICLVLKCQNGNMISIPNHMLRCTAILMNQLNLSYTNSTFPYATECIPIYYLSGIDLGAVCIFHRKCWSYLSLIWVEKYKCTITIVSPRGNEFNVQSFQWYGNQTRCKPSCIAFMWSPFVVSKAVTKLMLFGNTGHHIIHKIWIRIQPYSLEKMTDNVVSCGHCVYSLNVLRVQHDRRLLLAGPGSWPKIFPREFVRQCFESFG